jgi:hypothetical protein
VLLNMSQITALPNLTRLRRVSHELAARKNTPRPGLSVGKRSKSFRGVVQMTQPIRTHNAHFQSTISSPFTQALTGQRRTSG